MKQALFMSALLTFLTPICYAQTDNSLKLTVCSSSDSKTKMTADTTDKQLSLNSVLSNGQPTNPVSATIKETYTTTALRIRSFNEKARTAGWSDAVANGTTYLAYTSSGSSIILHVLKLSSGNRAIGFTKIMGPFGPEDDSLLGSEAFCK